MSLQTVNIETEFCGIADEYYAEMADLFALGSDVDEYNPDADLFDGCEGDATDADFDY